MQILPYFGILLLSYLLGSVPFGLIIVRLLTGRDIRKIESGRTGGTNAMRAAGFGAGLLTGVLDFLKSALAAWIAISLFPGEVWLHILAPLAAVLGHNYSIFIIERDGSGRLRLRGGAGGGPAAGGAFALWPPSVLIIAPVMALILYFIGYASLATLCVGLATMIIFAVRAWLGLSPWTYVIYGALCEVLLAWALRPNIRRLLNGTERLVGFRARRAKK